METHFAGGVVVGATSQSSGGLPKESHGSAALPLSGLAVEVHADRPASEVNLGRIVTVDAGRTQTRSRTILEVHADRDQGPHQQVFAQSELPAVGPNLVPTFSGDASQIRSSLAVDVHPGMRMHPSVTYDALAEALARSRLPSLELP
jgi:hypothetical protein